MLQSRWQIILSAGEKSAVVHTLSSPCKQFWESMSQHAQVDCENSLQKVTGEINIKYMQQHQASTVRMTCRQKACEHSQRLSR